MSVQWSNWNYAFLSPINDAVKYFFEVVDRYTRGIARVRKMRILNKRYITNTASTFWGTWDASALSYLGLDHFGKCCTKICRIQVKLRSKKFYCGWLRWWNFSIKRTHSVGRFLFLVIHGKAWKVCMRLLLRVAAKIFSY